jgi:putative RecB family exonuclease
MRRMLRPLADTDEPSGGRRGAAAPDPYGGRVAQGEDGGLLVTVASPGDGLPGWVSPSQLSTYESCPLRYYFGTVLGWREGPTTWTVAGNLVHDTFEALYRLPPVERDQERATALLRETAEATFAAPDTARFRTDTEVAHRAQSSVENLYLLESPTTLDVDGADLESPVDADLAGVRFGGRLDRLTREPYLRLTDYKTGKRPQPGHLGKALRQLFLYVVALRAVGVAVAEVELLYVFANARVRRPVFPAVLADTERALRGMRTASEADVERSAWQARKGALCGFCAFKPVCPAFRPGGPAPGSPESDAVLAQRGLTRRSRPVPEPVEIDRDTSVDEAEAEA